MATLPPMGDGTLLAIDSATELLCLAACGPAGERCLVQPGGAEASARLIAGARELLEAVGARWDTLDAIAFGQGPGAFTGLRTACAVAQGLALGTSRPVIALDSLLLVAEAAWPAADAVSDGSVAVVVDARMGEVYAARYARTADGWSTVEPPRLASPAAVAEAWQADPPRAWAGSGLALMAPAVPAAAAGTALSDEARAGALLRLARAAWRRGETVLPDAAWPVYVRDKVAQTTAERARLSRSVA